MSQAQSDGGLVGDPPTVSVVIPTYKRPTYLARAVNSVLGQTYEDFEIIIIDDNDAGTTYRDETRSLVRGYTNEPRVRAIEHPKNGGISAARNTGIQAARGSFVAFLDDDDVWLPDKLDRQLAAFASADPDVALVICGWTIRDVDGHIIRIEQPRLRGDVLEHLSLNRIGPPSAALCRRDAVLSIGGFDEAFRYREDTDFYLRLAMHFRFAFLEESLVDYLYHDQASSRRTRVKIGAYDQFLGKHEAFIQASSWRYSEYRERQADLHLEIEDVKQARRLFRQAIVAAPLRKQPYMKLAATLGGAESYQRARARYRQILGRR